MDEIMDRAGTTGDEANLQSIIASARRLGVEMDEEEAVQWLTSIAAMQSEANVVMDVESGVYGHRVTMLDFSPAELARFREDRPAG